MSKSRFIVSLDFELFWGVRDKRTIESYGKNILGVREAIPAMLDLFDRYGISATFATVGFLFAKDKDELRSYLPEEIPRFNFDKYSPYAGGYLDRIGNNEKEDPYHYGFSLLQQIREQGNQEIATHTFSHYYCLENATISSFEADLVSAKKIAGANGTEIRSIVFPRNQYSREHIDICKKQGIIAFRGNENSGLYQPRQNEEQSKAIRALRLMDSYLDLTGAHCFDQQNENGIINIPASRFLRPHSPRLAKLDGLKLGRIKKSMTTAARKNKSFHLWWHPHNFGTYLEENIEFLTKILEHYRMLNRDFGMESRSMKYIAEETLALHVV